MAERGLGGEDNAGGQAVCAVVLPGITLVPLDHSLALVANVLVLVGHPLAVVGNLLAAVGNAAVGRSMSRRSGGQLR